MTVKIDHDNWKFSQTNGALALFGLPFFLIAEDMVQVAYSYLGFPRRVVLDAQEIEEIDGDDGSLDLITDRMFLKVLWFQKEHEVKFCSEMLKHTFQQRYHDGF